jgi:hypothetical protein
MDAVAPGAARVAFIIRLFFNSIRLDVCALFIFLPPLLVFCISCHDLMTNWSPTCSHESRNDYGMISLFGPTSSCSDTEGLFTPVTATRHVLLTLRPCSSSGDSQKPHRQLS